MDRSLPLPGSVRGTRGAVAKLVHSDTYSQLVGFLGRCAWRDGGFDSGLAFLQAENEKG